MARVGLVLVLVLSVLGVVFAQNQIAEDCRDCDPSKCKEAKGCLAGKVKDRCGCCYACGKTEYELCAHPDIPSNGPYLGKCGDNLQCKVRDDLDDDEAPEALCYCNIEGTLCGSDGVSYDNLCQLMAGAARTNAQLTVDSKGPCSAKAKIISGPSNVKNRTGSDIAIVCEATGFPIPTIEWTWTRVDGKTEILPSDDLHISVNMRGGPEKWQITGWLQIMELQKENEGDYICLANNELGTDSAKARVIVVVDEEQAKKHRRKVKKHNISMKQQGFN